MIVALLIACGWTRCVRTVEEARRPPDSKRYFSDLFLRANIAPENIVPDLDSLSANAAELDKWNGGKTESKQVFADSKAASSFLSVCPERTRWHIWPYNGSPILLIEIDGPASMIGLSTYFDMLVLSPHGRGLPESEFAYIRNKQELAPGVVVGFHRLVK